MDTSEIEENLLTIGEPKLHDEMCKNLCIVYVKVITIFPDLEAARPRSTSAIQAIRRVKDIVPLPQSIGTQIAELLDELATIEFSLDPEEKQIGDEIVALLQQCRNFDSNSNDNNELESFHQAATKLGINSSRAALGERRALKKVIERARAEEDQRKESITAYLQHLMRKYSKLFSS